LLIVPKRQQASDQPPGDGSRESSVPSEIRRGKRTVRLSNLGKPYRPEEEITKGDLLRYYRDVASTLLPHIRDRPFTMKRYPDGWQGRPFFRKDVTNWAPPWLKRVAVHVTGRGPPRQSRTIEEMRVRSVRAQKGVFRAPLIWPGGGCLAACPVKRLALRTISEGAGMGRATLGRRRPWSVLIGVES
jgi:hypothetical protein